MCIYMSMYTHTNNTYFCLYSYKKRSAFVADKKAPHTRKSKMLWGFQRRLTVQARYLLYLEALSREMREVVHGGFQTELWEGCWYQHVHPPRSHQGVGIAVRGHWQNQVPSWKYSSKVFSHHFSFRTTGRTMGSLCNFSQQRCHVWTQTSVTVKGASDTNCMACHYHDSRRLQELYRTILVLTDEKELFSPHCHPSHTRIFTCSSSKWSLRKSSMLTHQFCSSPIFYSSHATHPHNSFLHALPSSTNSQTKG